MKKFFMDLISGKSDSSSKRFAALFTLFNLIAITWVATLKAKDYVTPEFMYDALALIAGGGLGLTVIEKIFSAKKEINNNDITKTDI
mgnify:CR=1 FL=1|jgi:hypothetical protein